MLGRHVKHFHVEKASNESVWFSVITSEFTLIDKAKNIQWQLIGWVNLDIITLVNHINHTRHSPHYHLDRWLFTLLLLTMSQSLTQKQFLINSMARVLRSRLNVLSSYLFTETLWNPYSICTAGGMERDWRHSDTATISKLTNSRLDNWNASLRTEVFKFLLWLQKKRKVEQSLRSNEYSDQSCLGHSCYGWWEEKSWEMST